MMWHGMFLFFIGMVTGMQEHRFKNMRMALSAHLEGVMNGSFLIAVGAIWGHVEVSPRAEKAARWTALYGTYGNWLFTAVGAALGTASESPILSQGHHGKPWQERLGGAGFRSMAYSILIAVMLLLCGITRRKPMQDNAVWAHDPTLPGPTPDCGSGLSYSRGGAVR
jgi:hydroxylaminobenzene mutase